MKLEPVTKIDKKNKKNQKIMFENCDVIVIFRIFGQFGADQRPDFEHRVSKIHFVINNNLCITKTENRTKKYLTQLWHYFFG